LELLSGRHYFWLLEAVATAAAVLAAHGAARQAVELYALVRRHPYAANSPWFEDVYGRMVAQAAAVLTPEIKAAAEAQGRTLDLWQAAKALLTA
jgi:hypothetical protein